MTHNQLIKWSCNIGTADNLLFTLSLSAEFQKWFGKVLYLFEFLHFTPIVILIWNEQFAWIHIILIKNSKTLLLLCHDVIFPNPSPIILLLCSCVLSYLDFPLFFYPMAYYPLSMLLPVRMFLVFHTFLQCLILVVQASGDDRIK